mmetsp:Transcript_42718/g.124128  ORF Transcript_42718/g.124128 Transcript_42718/m.124128 type:complete len:122 (-) Transcript_42718:1567-1932(-)
MQTACQGASRPGERRGCAARAANVEFRLDLRAFTARDISALRRAGEQPLPLSSERDLTPGESGAPQKRGADKRPPQQRAQGVFRRCKLASSCWIAACKFLTMSPTDTMSLRFAPPRNFHMT